MSLIRVSRYESGGGGRGTHKHTLISLSIIQWTVIILFAFISILPAENRYLPKPVLSEYHVKGNPEQLKG